ncbi:MAG: head GIN domain-containing protein [Novosphingobium sp.]|nr:head GIN domain-containing protein [Novosphingobium sp.]
MTLKSFLRGVAPLAAFALAAAASGGCDKMHVSLGGEEGKKLADLDLSGPPPSKVALLGPDTVRIATGDTLAISVDGDPDVAEQMRFTLEDGTLGILRKDGKRWGDETVTVNVTMPAPKKLTIAGSGKIFSPGLAGDSARVSVAGSGVVETDAVTTDSLKVDIAGSGSYRAAGSAKSLKVSIAGSGNARLEALMVDDAKVDIAGSGDTAFASDGTVKANIVGSGKVRVIGRATCKVTAMGSGRLVCEPAAASARTKPKGDKSSA